ncbi:TD and POZ domain-containing protein 3 [Trichonephila clavipes]|nr:TD and POZ domain-containing protein 3 [Trichonephila clavipes]
MSSEISDEEYEFTMWWNIENYLYCGQKHREELLSPLFTATSMGNTNWCFCLYPAGYYMENYFEHYLQRVQDDGPKSIEIDYVFEILGSDGSVLEEKHATKHEFPKASIWGLFENLERTRVFQFEKDNFLPLNTLTLRCRMRRCENRSQKRVEMFAKTVINFEKMSFIWDIKNFSSLTRDQRIPFVMNSSSKEVLMKLNLFLCEGRNSNEIIVIDFHSVNKKMKYFLFKAFLIADGGNKTYCNQREFWCEGYRENWMFSLLLTKMELLIKKDLYLKDDTLSLYCECFISTGISFHEIVSTKFEVIVPHNEPEVNILGKQSNNARTLKEDFETLKGDFLTLYTEGTLSDIKVCTESKSFPAHTAVLCARSPVFKAMFSNDMKEKIKGSVDIVDLDDDTVSRMLLYMYTDSVEDLQWESALRLYEAADKYEILSLRKKCSAFLADHLTPAYAGDALVLADRHQDNNFKQVVQNYILDRKECVFLSEEWKILLVNNSKLAAETMLKAWIKKRDKDQ